jgi:hypothetical protein
MAFLGASAQVLVGSLTCQYGNRVDFESTPFNLQLTDLDFSVNGSKYIFVKSSRLRVATQEVSGSGEDLTFIPTQYWG